jgi:hypothetical protein
LSWAAAVSLVAIGPLKPASAEIPSVQIKRLETSQPKSAALKYFAEIAFTGEFIGPSPTHPPTHPPMIRKWQEDIRIRVYGSPTAADWATLAEVIKELNGLIDGIEVSFADAGTSVNIPEPPDANLDIFFVPESAFSRYLPSYRPVNYGFFWTWSNAKGRIRQAKILVASRLISQRERSHLIREELTQALGLMQDSFSYADSIFYQNWTATTQYSDLDRAVLKMLYRPEILPGMSQAEALEILEAL